jgi:hypothetical protein
MQERVLTPRLLQIIVSGIASTACHNFLQHSPPIIAMIAAKSLRTSGKDASGRRLLDLRTLP